MVVAQMAGAAKAVELEAMAGVREGEAKVAVPGDVGAGKVEQARTVAAATVGGAMAWARQEVSEVAATVKIPSGLQMQLTEPQSDPWIR